MAHKSFLSDSIRAIMMAGFGSALIAAPAMAQDQTDDEQEAKETVEKIQVTGSRIRTDGLDSPTPIEIITTEIAEDQGLNTLGELLRTSTVASGSDQLVSAYSVGFVTNGGSGAESISMRGLGAGRTLVLLNGRRAGPAGTRGTVSAFDMNALPISVIERVEILKDGASSLYGSDAVAGVINIITKKGEGGQVNVSGNQPFEGGGETYRFNATYGSAFDRGSWRAVVDHNVNTGLKRADRDYFDCSTRYLFSDIETGERADPIDPRTGEYHCNESGFGLWHSGSAGTGRVQYNYGGYDVPHVTETNPNITEAPEGWYWAGYDKESDGLLDGGGHPFRLDQTMIPETTVNSAYVQADYDLTDTISAYGELLYSQRVTKSRSARQFWPADLVGFVPVSTVPGFDGDSWVMPVHYTNHYGNETTVDYSRIVLGLEGSIGFWNWDVSYQRSQNDGTYEQDIILRDSMLMAQETLLGVPCEGRVTSISGKACYEYDWFDPQNIYGNPSQEARDFLFGYDKGNTEYNQDTIDAYITGDLFEMPAGPVGTAVGVYWQRDEINDVPGENTRAGNSWGLSGAGITAGEAKTTAAYAEFQVPLLRDLPFVESLDLTTSGRWTDVDIYGSDTTFKVSANWEIGAGFRVRASRGSSFRAPALYELFLQNQTGFLGQINDPCLNWTESTNPQVRENCAAEGIPESYTTPVGSSGSMTSITGGGAGQLKAETSISEGIGLVYSTDDGRFAASVDYYDVVISDQISSVAGSSVLGQCYTSEDFANEPFCNQITRRDGSADGDWSILEVRGGYLNTAQQVVRGVDIVVTYQDSFDFGDLRIKLDHTNQIERSFQQFATDTPVQYIGRIGNPRNVGTLNTTLTRDDWSFNWNMGYYDNTSNYHVFDTSSTTYRGETVRFVAETPTYVLHSLSASTTFNDNIEVTLGVGNIFDKQPPKVSPAASYTVGNVPLFASQLDYLGRRAFFNVSYNF